MLCCELRFTLSGLCLRCHCAHIYVLRDHQKQELCVMSSEDMGCGTDVQTQVRTRADRPGGNGFVKDEAGYPDEELVRA